MCPMVARCLRMSHDAQRRRELPRFATHDASMLGARRIIRPTPFPSVDCGQESVAVNSHPPGSSPSANGRTDQKNHITLGQEYRVSRPGQHGFWAARTPLQPAMSLRIAWCEVPPTYDNCIALHLSYLERMLARAAAGPQVFGLVPGRPLRPEGSAAAASDSYSCTYAATVWPTENIVTAR